MVACQAHLSMGFSRQEYWSGLSFPFPGDLTDRGIKLVSPVLQVDSLPSEPPGKVMGGHYEDSNTCCHIICYSKQFKKQEKKIPLSVHFKELVK